MKGHATKKILLSYIQNTLNARRAMAVRQHMDACDLCSGNAAILEKIIAPSKGKKIKPPQSVLKGILTYYDNFNRHTDTVPALRRLRLRHAVIAFGAACACMMIYTLSVQLQYENAPIYAARVKGTVRADKNMLHKGQMVRPGVLLTTGEDSKLSIMYGKVMKLIAGPHSRISITKSHIDKKSGKIYFEMVIDRGSIFAETDKGWKLQYTLVTPHGKVSSTGSRIAMKVEPLKTRVMVKNGIANLSSNKGHSVNAEEGSGYSITDKEVTSAMEMADEDSEDNSTLYDNTVKDLLDDDYDDADTVIQ